MGIAINNDAVRIPSEEDIRLQLTRILCSPEFQTSGRGRRFLSFIIDQTLAGRADYLKAFNIAMEVFGRNSAFDAQTDPVVRIEAGHIRRALERYYLVAGGADDVIITIPKGAYIPSFDFGPMHSHSTMADNGHPTASQDSRSAHKPGSREPGFGEKVPFFFNRREPPFWKLLPITLAAIALIIFFEPFMRLLFSTPVSSDRAMPQTVILVETFASNVSDQRGLTVAKGLTDEVITQLADHPNLAVAARFGNGSAGENGRADMTYVVQGSVHTDEGMLRVAVRLIRQSDSVIIWANSYDAALPPRQDSGTMDLQIRFARQIADKVASSEATSQ